MECRQCVEKDLLSYLSNSIDSVYLLNNIATQREEIRHLFYKYHACFPESFLNGNNNPYERDNLLKDLAARTAEAIVVAGAYFARLLHVSRHDGTITIADVKLPIGVQCVKLAFKLTRTNKSESYAPINAFENRFGAEKIIEYGDKVKADFCETVMANAREIYGSDAPLKFLLSQEERLWLSGNLRYENAMELIGKKQSDIVSCILRPLMYYYIFAESLVPDSHHGFVFPVIKWVCADPSGDMWKVSVGDVVRVGGFFAENNQNDK